MSESGGINENLDAGLRNEDNQEDRMPASTQPNSRVSVDSDHEVMTLMKESCVIKPIGSGNCLGKRKPVDTMVEDHVADTNGNVELEISQSTPAHLDKPKVVPTIWEPTKRCRPYGIQTIWYRWGLRPH